ncbi:uncharacterized protein [Coffea arabica]|uniref:Reverse transcriptase n=1 Tax=Coffea arabica TaxID=13443 RepID=A0ABM4WNB3_COFAR
MTQLKTKMNDMGKEFEGSSSSKEVAQLEGSKLEPPKEVAGRREFRTINKLPKIDLPIFDGGNPKEWIRKANKYFKIHGIEDEMKAEVAELYFRDRADIWFHGVFYGREAIPWEELTTALCIRFGEGKPEEAIEEFNKLAQAGSVADYLKRFEMLKALVMPSLPHLSDSYYKACFMRHVCKQSHIYYLLAEEAETAEGSKEQEEEVYCDCINGELVDEHIEVSIHTLAGGAGHKTIKLKGLVKGKQVTTLIDSGSTHCFLDEQLAKELKLSTQGPNLIVNVANGERVESKGLDKSMQWEMQGHQFQYAFNTLRLGGCDIILRVDWLAKHSPIEFNFKELSMMIHKGEQEIVLRGEDTSTSLKMIRGSRLDRWLRKQAYGMVGQLVAIKEEDGTVKNKFPMPLIEELIDELHGARYFTKIDLRAGYFQIRVKEEDIPKTAFKTHQGLYEFKVMLFGLTNAPATFQGLMNQIFQDQMRKHVLVFFDDILVYNPTLELHVKHVTKVMNLLRQHQLYAKMSKCSFAQLQVEYLGHIISAEGVQADPKKIECMENWPKPTNIKQLRGFMGLTGYYRRFVKGYGAIARPMTNLLKKDNFHWSEDAEKAFQELKGAMCHTPVLAVPDFTQPFIIETDACYTGTGAVLM